MGKNFSRYLIAALLTCAGNAFAFDPIPPDVTLLDPATASSLNIKQTFIFDRVRANLHVGDAMGHSASGVFCSGKRALTVTQAWLPSYEALVKNYSAAELRRLGYAEPNSTAANAFDPTSASAPDYRIGVLLKNVTMEDCGTGNSFEGWVHTEFDWALFSEKEQRVIFEKTTEGLGKSEQKIEGLGKKAIISSFDNFLADPGFVAAINKGNASGSGDSVAAVPASTTPSAGVTAPEATPAKGVLMQLLGPASRASGDAQKNQADLRKAVVTLQTASGTGSGFYIDRGGYLLTDYHVVKGTKYVKVKFANGDKMIGEVVREDERNDIALIKTAEIGFEPLLIAEKTPDVGEDVYAIGTPLGVLESTMTRGILSADRTDSTTHMHKLQSDVSITSGNSGGPLLDKQGHVIGLTQSRLATSSGFNFFIPIQDALQALNVTVK